MITAQQVEQAAKQVLKTKRALERSFSGTREEEDAAYAAHIAAIKAYGAAKQQRFASSQSA